MRYFNKETGYGGKAYQKRTEKAMCDELGPKEEYMAEFVEQFASLCDVNDTSKGCSEQQIQLIKKSSGKTVDDMKWVKQRLQGMAERDGSSMTPEALKWVKQRISIFDQLLKKAGSDEL